MRAPVSRASKPPGLGLPFGNCSSTNRSMSFQAFNTQVAAIPPAWQRLGHPFGGVADIRYDFRLRGLGRRPTRAPSTCIQNSPQPEPLRAICYHTLKLYARRLAPKAADHPRMHAISPFVPAQVLPSSERKYSIRLFVRPPGAEKFLYAGELAPSHVLVESINADRGAAHFYLTPTLPSKVLAELGGLLLGEMDAVALDEALDRLKQPTTVRDRLDILRQVVNFWHDPVKPEDGMSGVEQVGGVPLPLPLQFWYGWAGKRTEVMTGQNILFTPRDYRYRSRILRVEDGRLHFHVENQGVYEWTTLPEGKDPPVFG